MTDAPPMTLELANDVPGASVIVSSVLLGELDLRHTDCMAMMRETPDKAYDLAIVDLEPRGGPA